MAEQSIALSDFVLCVVSFYAAGLAYKRHIYASFGFLLVGAAAGVGTIRFLSIVTFQNRHHVVRLHTRLSWLAAILGIPLLGASFCHTYNQRNGCLFHIIAAGAGIILSYFYPNLEACTRFPSTLGILSILFLCFGGKNGPGVVGAVLYAISGTLIGTSGHIMGIQRINIFHYCLAIANMALMQALYITEHQPTWFFS